MRCATLQKRARALIADLPERFDHRLDHVRVSLLLPHAKQGGHSLPRSQPTEDPRRAPHRLRFRMTERRDESLHIAS
jgi:hypothetical protein